MNEADAQIRPVRTKKAIAKPQGLMVLGMHRSGTSACTRVLNLMGCALPDDLLGPDEGNQTGHWESTAIVALNDEMLATAGSTWEDWGPINADWRASAIRGAMVDRAAAVVKDHAALGPLFAMKDPRLCRLADVWVDAMTAADVEPLVLLMLRNPADVCGSLESRDLMLPGYGQLLWLRHVLDAEYFTRGQRRIVCRYDQLLSNWQGMMYRIKTDLGVSFPRNSPATHVQVEQFLSISFRHHDTSAQAVFDNPAYSDWLRQTFAILHEWSEGTESPHHYDDLDIIRTEFDRAYAVFARLLIDGNGAGELGSGSNLKRELMMQLEGARRATELMQQTETDLADAIAQRTDLTAQLATTAARADELQRGMESLQADAERLSEVTAEAEQLRIREGKLTAQLATTAARADELQRGMESLQADAERLSEVTAEAEQLRIREGELTGRLASAESTLIQRQEELAQTWKQLLTAERALAEASVSAAQERDRRQESDKRAAAVEVELSNLRIDTDRSSAVAASRIDNFVSEIAQLSQWIRENEKTAQALLATSAAEKQQMEALSDENVELTDRVSQLEAANLQADAARSEAEQKLAARFDEIARITAMLADEGHRAAAARDNVQWLRDVQKVTSGFPRWWALLPRNVRRKREFEIFLC